MNRKSNHLLKCTCVFLSQAYIFISNDSDALLPSHQIVSGIGGCYGSKFVNFWDFHSWFIHFKGHYFALLFFGTNFTLKFIWHRPLCTLLNTQHGTWHDIDGKKMIWFCTQKNEKKIWVEKSDTNRKWKMLLSTDILTHQCNQQPWNKWG